MLSRYVTRAAAKMASDVTGKAVTLLVTIAAARVLERQDFGTFALAMTAGWLLGVASDAGLPAWLARAVATLPAQAGRSYAVALRARAALAVPALAAGAVLALTLAPAHSRTAFFLVVVAQVAGAVIETVYHLFRGLERSEIEAGVHAAHRLAVAALAGLALWQAPSLPALALALAAPAALTLAAVVAIASNTLKHLALSPPSASAFAEAAADGPVAPPAPLASASARLATDNELRRDLAEAAFGREGGPRALIPREALPIGAGVLISALYFRLDVFVVERFHGLDVVAGYNAVFRIIEGLRLLPAAALVVAFPLMCRADSTRLLRRLSAWLGAAGAALLVVTALAAVPLVTMVYGSRYVDAAPALRVLAWSLPLLFVNYALTSQVIAWGGQRAFLWTTAGALAVNVGANLLLVPPLAGVGAAWATFITEIAVSIGCLLALRALRHPAAGVGESLSFVPGAGPRVPNAGQRAVP